MTDTEIITKIIELSKSSIGFPLVFWAAYLLKRYVINGNIKRYFRAKRRELKAIEQLGMKLDDIIAYHGKESVEEEGEKCRNNNV